MAPRSLTSPALHRRAAGRATRPTALVMVVLAAAACGPSVASPSVLPLASAVATPTPTDTGLGGGSTPASAGPTRPPDAEAIYRQIAGQVSTIRQLDLPDRVEPTVIDGPTLVKNLTREFETTNPPDEIAKSERLLKLMGLLGPNVSLARAYLDLQGSQVIGYYDPKVKQLFIVSRNGAVGAIEEVTYAHEFTHELQDRRFDLNSLGLDTIKDDSDRVLAILSLVEGDALSAQTSWMAANLTPAQLGEVATAGSDPAMLAVLAATPRILLETSIFPYQAGAAYVGNLLAQGGYSTVDAAYTQLPASSEQILHPEAAPSVLKPIRLAIPGDLAATIGTGWTASAQDTFGELQARVWLREGGVAGDVARIAAEGWGGDRVVLLDGPAGAGAVFWTTAWDSSPDAREFESAARVAIAGLRLDTVVLSSGTRVAMAIRSRSPGTPSDATLRSILESLVRG
ncbi:MAG: hypothetical protein HYX54_09860 [Chloroflexi bacterium]|nr:hypothetical protein [Chloroflexota bacterium]